MRSTHSVHFFIVPGHLVELARAVRARPCAQVAAHALVLVDEHDAVGALVRCAGRADADAVGIGAMHARQRKIDRLRRRIVADLVVAHAVEPHARRLGAKRLVVGERTAHLRRSVPLLARDRTGVTPTQVSRSMTSPSFICQGRKPARCDSARRAAGGRCRPAAASRRRTPARCRSRPARICSL